MNKKILEKIMQKKEFSQISKKDIELALEHFNKPKYLDEEKVKLTRGLLRKVFSAFLSSKILVLGKKIREEDWILRKHISTKERLSYYSEIYGRIFKRINAKEVSVIDLGAGINGFSYKYFKITEKKINYTAVESVGQLVHGMNEYFMKNNIKGRAFHESLFDLEEIQKIIKKTKQPRVVFLFKVIDSLEIIKKDYSKRLLEEIAPLVDKIVLSFATRSLFKREKFKARRNWIINFIKKEFKILDDFELMGERYLVLENFNQVDYT